MKLRMENVVLVVGLALVLILLHLKQLSYADEQFGEQVVVHEYVVQQKVMLGMDGMLELEVEEAPSVSLDVDVGNGLQGDISRPNVDIEKEDRKEEQIDSSTLNHSIPKGCVNPMESSFTDGRFLFQGPCAEGGFSRWLKSSEEVCEILSRVDLYILAQSTERRILYTIMEMLLGKSYAFSETIDDSTQQLFDTKILPIRDLVTEEFGSSCLRYHYHYLKWGQDIASAMKSIVEDIQVSPTRKPVILFQFGLYILAGGTWINSEKASIAMSTIISDGTVEMAAEKGITLLWRPPAAVNPRRPRFLSHYKPPRDANTILRHFRDYTNPIALENKMDVFDVFDQTEEGYKAGVIKFETGKEWKPRQLGGIHMYDHGRKIVTQLLLSKLKYIVELEKQKLFLH